MASGIKSSQVMSHVNTKRISNFSREESFWKTRNPFNADTSVYQSRQKKTAVEIRCQLLIHCIDIMMPRIQTLVAVSACSDTIRMLFFFRYIFIHLSKWQSCDFYSHFSNYAQLRLMFTLLFIVNIHYMFQPNWSCKGVKAGLSR
jgi:hypothetical protein